MRRHAIRCQHGSVFVAASTSRGARSSRRGGRTAAAEARREHVVAQDKAQAILSALGGGDNIVEIEPCITRLRCEVEDGSKVDEAGLKAAGAHGVMLQGEVVQVVVGPEADTLAGDIEDLM
ncbi:glucose PTS transporter subunit EIIB [Saccharopolyspora sp. TS4A08]|uniref:Glucose PTS transporter subunit EIIB n=1 Tax=Saccharopolyspora ipomoeae TaxID=3042027 RepID=A0ABT6PIG9_9PSEU|nr:glucose PTS transporter subunit EIIB [Saccharopolyspora sp. TS4A08]MDI2027443.1 glucose PTS transporter subunit EIIB [Saccharopolyspora sp. TS4A08]